MKSKIWMYWDNPTDRTSPPDYIELCWESIRKHCETDFDVHIVTTENVKQFLPNISDDFFQIAQINNKSNFLRYTLLKEYGGIWLDSDLVLFRSLKPLLNLFKTDTPGLETSIDLVATASPGLNYGEPECGFLLSKKNGVIIKKAAALINHALNLHPPGHIFKWGSMGPGIIRQAVKGKKYHHLDYNLLMQVKSWEAYKFGGREPIDKYCDQNAYGCMLFHQMFKDYNHPILQMNRQQLLESPILLGQIFRRALKPNES
jgi:mannosyltransferase OCH1-like enzyme